MLYKLRKLAWKTEPCQNCLAKARKVVANIVHRQAQDVDPEFGGLLGDPAGCQLWQKKQNAGAAGWDNSRVARREAHSDGDSRIRCRWMSVPTVDWFTL